MLVKKKSNLARKIVKAFVVLTIISIPIYVVFFTEALRIQAVEINGNGASPEEISYLIGEDAVGSNILLWKPRMLIEDVDDDITKKLASFEIKKVLIERKIVVSISEREKKLIWCFNEIDPCFWTDKDGVLFDSAPRTNGNLIHSIKETTSRTPQIGARIIDEGLWVNLNKILIILDEIGLPLESINIPDIKFRELIVNPINGPQIIFGLNIDPDFTKAAITSLRSSKNKTSWQNIKSINLTVHGRVYTTSLH